MQKSYLSSASCTLISTTPRLLYALCYWIMFYNTYLPCWARLVFSPPNHSAGTDDHLLAFEVTRLRNVVGLVVLVLFHTEKNVKKRSTSNFVRPARRPRRCRPYLSFQLQIIQNSSSARKRVPQPRGKIQNPKSHPPLPPKHYFTYLTSMLTS